MKRLWIGIAAILMGATCAGAQSMEDLNIQIHGYATQGFLYSNNNNMLTTDSTDGSPAWTEAVVNVTAQPSDKLRVGVQARYFLLGNYGNAISLDYASADYTVNDKFGIRFGKVKTPSGLFNEVQDIDPSYIWSLLPQTIYPISSRNSVLAHYGGVAYGTLKLGLGAGKLEYRAWAGELAIPGGDGYLLNFEETGSQLPNGIQSPIFGAALHWKTPITGLMVGASIDRVEHLNGQLATSIKNSMGTATGTLTGTFTLKPYQWGQYFFQYEKNRLMVAGEAETYNITPTIAYPSLGIVIPANVDYRSWYAMATYKLTNKLTAGSYYTQEFSPKAALGPTRYLKDFALSGRYDFNQFLYAKAEEHFAEGTLWGYDLTLNPGGLKPSSKQTILKIGVSF